MGFCVANGCQNQHGKYDTAAGVSYHKIPDKDKEPERYAAWYAAIGLKKLPKTGKLCSAHFTEDNYQESQRLKLTYCNEYEKIKRLLKPDAVPSIFCHRPIPTPRQSSLDRSATREHNEVNKLLYLVQYIF